MIRRRDGLLISTSNDFNNLNAIFPLLLLPGNKLKVLVSNVRQLTDRMIGMIEKFHTVELENVLLKYCDIHSMLNMSTSKINKLILNGCHVYYDGSDSHIDSSPAWESVTKRGFVKCFKSLTIIEGKEFLNFINKCRFKEVIEEFQVHSYENINPSDYQHLKKFGIKELNFKLNKKPLKKLYVNSLENVEFSNETKNLYACITVYNPPTEFIGDISSQNISKFVILNCFTRQNLDEIMKRISVFEEVVIPESFLKLNQGDLKQITNPKLKMITIMTSHQNRIIVKILRARLEILFPFARILIKKMKQRIIRKPSKLFEQYIWYDIETITKFENILQRIDFGVNQCIYLRGESSKSVINQINLLMNNICNLFEERRYRNVNNDLMIELYFLEGLKANIESALQKCQTCY